MFTTNFVALKSPFGISHAICTAKFRELLVFLIIIIERQESDVFSEPFDSRFDSYMLEIDFSKNSGGCDVSKKHKFAKLASLLDLQHFGGVAKHENLQLKKDMMSNV